MRWLSISAVSSAIGYVGWKIGTMVSSGSAGLWLSFVASMLGLWAGMVLFPRRD
jgi:hypothetical protein